MKNHTIIRSGEIKSPLKSVGLGDAVAIVAQPIAKAIDAATAHLPSGLQTHVAQCGGCKKRHEAWNAAVPNVFTVRRPNVDTKK